MIYEQSSNNNRGYDSVLDDNRQGRDWMLHRDLQIELVVVAE